MTTQPSPRVLPAADPQVAQLCARGWKITEESFGAKLQITPGVRQQLARIDTPDLCIRPLVADDMSCVLDLDALTLGDYPGGVATAHASLTRETACPTPTRRAWGAFRDSELVAMTWFDTDASGTFAEIDFTVVAPHWRGRGVATALKAAAIVALANAGVDRIRTGGSMRNTAIIRTNEALGFVIDEHWVTLEA